MGMKAAILLLLVVAATNASLLRGDMFKSSVQKVASDSYHFVGAGKRQGFNFTYEGDLNMSFFTDHHGGKNSTSYWWSYGLVIKGDMYFNFELWIYEFEWVNITSTGYAIKWVPFEAVLAWPYDMDWRTAPFCIEVAEELRGANLNTMFQTNTRDCAGDVWWSLAKAFLNDEGHVVKEAFSGGALDPKPWESEEETEEEELRRVQWYEKKDSGKKDILDNCWWDQTKLVQFNETLLSGDFLGKKWYTGRRQMGLWCLRDCGLTDNDPVWWNN